MSLCATREPTTRQRVVDAADALFYERGFRAVGMDELRAAADVSLKRLYQLYPSKESLVLAVLDHRHRVWTQAVAQAVDEATSPHERLLAVYDFLAGWFRTDTFRGCVFINAFGELGSSSPAVAALARAHKEGYRASLAELVADAGLPAALTDQLLLLAEGAQTTAAITGDPGAATHARRAAQTLVDAARRGAGQAPQTS